MNREKFGKRIDVTTFYHKLADVEPSTHFQTPAYTENKINGIMAKGREQAKLIPSQLHGIWAFGFTKWLNAVTQHEPDANKRITKQWELKDLIVQE